MWENLRKDIQSGDIKALARALSLIENETPGYLSFMQSLQLQHNARVIGITGPPGAGKSTLTDALIGALLELERKVAVLCVDPSSPFHLGALLGDRIRMNQWYAHPQVYIRSLASRGNLGGLHPKILEMTDVLKEAGFDDVIIETVGVGQSEIEIAGLANTTVVVLVPEAGDEIQTMKAGLMEIADIFVVNKADRPGAALFVKNLQHMLTPVQTDSSWKTPVISTIATNGTGIAELITSINAHSSILQTPERKLWLMADKAYRLLQQKCMKGIRRSQLKEQLTKSIQHPGFNLYQWVEEIL
ncbi:MAG: methylmalonyl Co-A mutase-associated GTPase MeaB [Sphingobacteriales bacterium]|uniref:methylmalonyl Co-A mutase-associated GTPase MeaB n=1 Tax=Hydrotalea flava TaxID=714549 RepID=UPI0008366F5A|nr:methylmalonyl Co-A mutase-associated GTPase MeaB [Hydrotalea flava]RTL56934.1 MAG: methylmalonyl Co-A mutase-associated GTPase MeaB [Sphingobacteriales bacterium]